MKESIFNKNLNEKLRADPGTLMDFYHALVRAQTIQQTTGLDSRESTRGIGVIRSEIERRMTLNFAPQYPTPITARTTKRRRGN